MIWDITSPTIVITGAWNVPIFTPSWVSRHLFEYPVGAEVDVAQMLSARGENRFYIKNLGIYAEPQRLLLFLNGASPQHRRRMEALLARIFTVLPHTPIGSLGVNFRFVQNPAADALLDKLMTHEGIEQHHNILATQHKSRISVDADWVCNLDRQGDLETFQIELNYHFEKFGEIDDKIEKTTGLIGNQLDHALKLMKDIYELEGYQVTAVDFSEMGQAWGEE